jgi:putative RNA 2'-phosphotransferase
MFGERWAAHRHVHRGVAEQLLDDLDAIRRDSLQPRARRLVHLSRDVETATTVARRRGRPIVLIVRAGEMAADRFELYLSDNGVWLTRHVPPRFITFP